MLKIAMELCRGWEIYVFMNEYIESVSGNFMWISWCRLFQVSLQHYWISLRLVHHTISHALLDNGAYPLTLSHIRLWINILRVHWAAQRARGMFELPWKPMEDMPSKQVLVHLYDWWPCTYLLLDDFVPILLTTVHAYGALSTALQTSLHRLGMTFIRERR